MTSYRLTATLADPRHALPRLVARLHALGAVITSLHHEGQQVRATVDSPASLARVQAVAARGIDVRLVVVRTDEPRSTTYVVSRQDRALTGEGSAASAAGF